MSKVLTFLSAYKLYAWAGVVVVLIAAFGYSTVAAYKWGKENGEQRIQALWDKEEKERLVVTVNQLDSSLTQSRENARVAAEQARNDLEAALRASEERQALRSEAAVRQASIDTATRVIGSAYLDPRCRIDQKTFQEIQRALK